MLTKFKHFSHAGGDPELSNKKGSNTSMAKMSFPPQPPPAVQAKADEKGGETSSKILKTTPTAKKVAFKPPPPIDEEEKDSEEEEFGEEVDYDPYEDMSMRKE